MSFTETFRRTRTVLPNGSIMFHLDLTIGNHMPRKIYTSEQARPGGGTMFHVPWERIEDFLRGKDRYAGSNAVLKDGEYCEFVVTHTGLNVYVVDADGK
jgi:hypothetical protein